MNATEQIRGSDHLSTADTHIARAGNNCALAADAIGFYDVTQALTDVESAIDALKAARVELLAFRGEEDDDYAPAADEITDVEAATADEFARYCWIVRRLDDNARRPYGGRDYRAGLIPDLA